MNIIQSYIRYDFKKKNDKMQKISVKLISNLIEKTINKGPRNLHEPLFIGNEIKYIQDTIKKILSLPREFT